jgi:hypothetical protein
LAPIWLTFAPRTIFVFICHVSVNVLISEETWRAVWVTGPSDGKEFHKTGSERELLQPLRK